MVTSVDTCFVVFRKAFLVKERVIEGGVNEKCNKAKRIKRGEEFGKGKKMKEKKKERRKKERKKESEKQVRIRKRNELKKGNNRANEHFLLKN